MIKVIIKPARSIFGGRRQWKFEIRAANGKRIDPRDTYANRADAVTALVLLFDSDDPVEMVLQDRRGNVDSRTRLR